jgi:hypothetical protein
MKVFFATVIKVKTHPPAPHASRPHKRTHRYPNLALELALTLALALGSLLLISGQARAWQLKPLGMQALSVHFRYENTAVGGLSGLDYDPVRGVHYALSDDRSSNPPARFYTLAIDPERFMPLPPGHTATPASTANEPLAAAIRFQRVTPLQAANGRLYPRGQVDPEALRLSSDGQSLLWNSEGQPSDGIPPTINQSTLDGQPVRQFALPSYYQPAPPWSPTTTTAPDQGIRNNRAFESLAIDHERGRVLVGLENALRQDGPAADGAQGSPSRLLLYEEHSARRLAEYVYPTAAAITAAALPAWSATNGLVELLHLEGDHYLALERSYGPLSGSHIRLYLISLTGATNVSDWPSLKGRDYQAVSKTLLLDLSAAGLPTDNIEAMSWAAPRPSGNRTLLLLADNNFNPLQTTLFLLFELIP